MIKVTYMINGKSELSIYDAQWFDLNEAIQDVVDLMPNATNIMAQYL